MNQSELVFRDARGSFTACCLCLTLQADHSPWVRDGFKHIPQRLGFIFKWGKKTLTVPTEKRKQNSNTGCFSFPNIYPQVAVVCVSKACLSVLSGRIMRSLSLSASLCLSHDSQSIWFYANKRGAGPIKSLCVRGAPPHTLRGVAIKEKREGERECHHLLQPFKPSENGDTGASSNTFIYSTHSSSSNYFTNSTSTLLTGQNVLSQLAFWL